MAQRSDARGLVSVASTVLELTDTVDARTLAPAASEAPASLPPRYELVGALGEGGMGHVDHVRDKDLLRDVAAKYLLPELRRDRAQLEQFLWEARVTAYLDHPNIVPVHELGTTPDGEVFFTMKLARGASLEHDLRAVRDLADPDADLARRLRIFVNVCNAVAFAHSRGVLHRDLKPANVLVGGYGEVLVSDWGLALPLDGAGDELRAIVPSGLARRSAGTPVYMSPEQARGDTLDARSDIYTLGAILYELVALKHPIEEESLVPLLAKASRGEIVPIAQAKPGVSSAMAAVVHKAMAPAPEGRYRDAVELARDVELVLAGGTPAAEQASLLTKAARYYVARDPAFGKMRVFDIDMFMASSSLLGAALAAAFASQVAPFWWVLLIASLVAGARPMRMWLKSRNER